MRQDKAAGEDSMIKRVSVIIPVYRTEKYLEATVRSVLSQSYPAIEILLIDDGSPDGAPALCDRLASEYQNVQVYHKENGGLSDARNYGLERAVGVYTLFLDSDDTLSPEAIGDMVKIIEKECSDAVYPRLYYKVYESQKEQVLCSHFPKKDFLNEPRKFADRVLIGMGRAHRATAVLYRTQILKEYKLKFPYGKISEDFFFNLQFLFHAKRISLYEKPSLYNLKRKGSISASYYKDFFSTILEMDDAVIWFNSSIPEMDQIKGENARQTLLYRNVLIYAIDVMGDLGISYRKRKHICIDMFQNKRFQAVLYGQAGLPYFEGKLRRYYMKASKFFLVKGCNAVTCRLAWIAAKINKV